MEILTGNSGSYPRVGESEEQLRLRQAYQKWETGEISDNELEEVYKSYTKEVIREQEKAGLDIVTDGQLRWYDPISHFARNIEGCDINGLLRYFDTNFYFRQPVIVDEVSWKEPTVKSEFLYADKISKKTLKPVLTGPYTLSKYSIDKYYNDIEDLTLAFSDIVSNEVEELVRAGAKEIQIDEPAILGEEGDYEIFATGIEKVAEAKGSSQLDLYVYFGDSTNFYDRFQDLPIDFLGLDFTYSPELPDLIESRGSDKLLGLGLIDARNTKMEKTEEVVSTVKKVASSIVHDKIYLNPSCGLEYLPRKRAYEKIQHMVEIAENAEGVIE